MKQLILFLTFFLVAAAASFGQCTIRGKITDGNGETIIGASVVLKSNWAVGTVTDIDGNYSLKIPDSTIQTLVISSLGFKHIEEIVRCTKGGVIIKNFVMEPDAKEIGAVQVVAKASKSKDYYVETIKKNSATTLDYVSSESMKKAGDANVVAAVTRVSGVSTTSNGFITVRGIGDRYVKTAINGSRIPTLDPFTNNIKLDMFPASLVDNVMITKTASPDLPGDWAGAFISVETKDYPEQLTLNFENSIGYNSQSSMNEVVSSQRSSTDWLGYDDGLRDYNHNQFEPAIITPTTYQEFVALGLGDYYRSLGVTGTTPWNDTYYRLGLVQLGLLAPAQINDNDAYTAAVNSYVYGTYQSDAFKVINADVPMSARAFPANWNVSSRPAPLDFSQSFSIGNQVSLFGKPLGFLVGYRYGSSMYYDPNSTVGRIKPVDDGNGTLVLDTSSFVRQQASKETNGWSALMNIAYKLNPNNSVSLMFMPNLIGVNNVRYGVDNGDVKTVILNQSQYYEQRRQLVYQVKTDHYLPGPKMKIEFNASYTGANSSVPDFKNVQYWQNSDGTYQIGGSIGDGIHRYYRYLADNLFDSRVSAEMPLEKNTDLLRKLKFGGAYQKNERESNQYDYQVLTTHTIHMTSNNIDVPLALDNFDIRTYSDSSGITHSALDLYYFNENSPANHTFGRSEIAAGFVMIDYTLTPALRFSGGLRVEKAKMLTDVYVYDSLGYAPDDLRRAYSSSLPLVNPGKLNQVSLLPSINIIYKLNQFKEGSDVNPLNLRLNFSQTVARPGIRELSDVAVYDYEFRSYVYGNSNLKMVRINNYDLRLEDYFKSGDNVSLSIFHKDFIDHIELVSSSGYTWQNVPKAYVSGIEVEGRKSLTKHFELRGNLTFVKSSTTFNRARMDISGGVRTYIPLDTVTHSMFGQSPYVLNGTLAYTSDTLGLTLTLSYNVQGPKLVIASGVKETPDVYERERHLLDVKAIKTLGKHFSASFTVRDILNSAVRRTYMKEGNYYLDYEKFNYGTSYVLALLYKL